MRNAMKVGTYVPALLIIYLVTPAGQAQESDRIYYGSRAGMHLTVVSREGIGTARAVVRVEHTPKDAKAYCVEYALDNSMACVKRTMAGVKVGDRVTADCVTRTWTDMYGQSFAFLGPAKRADETMADFAIRDLKTGEILDGSSASGYGVELAIFQHLCPGVTS
jgi:hypothetical protein